MTIAPRLPARGHGRGMPAVRRYLPLVAAVLGPLVVALVVLPWRTDLPGSAAALLMVVAVVAVAARGHRVAGLLAAVSAAAWFDLFLTTPYGSFDIAGRDDIETAVLLLAVGAAVTELAVRGRRHRAVAELDASYLAAIARTAELAGGGAGVHATAAAVRDELRRILGTDEVRFERGQLGGMPHLAADGRLVTDDGWWPTSQVGLPPMPFEIVAERGGVGYGRFVVDGRGAHPDPTALQVAKVLADQTATALARSSRARTS